MQVKPAHKRPLSQFSVITEAVKVSLKWESLTYVTNTGNNQKIMQEYGETVFDIRYSL